MEHSVAEKQQFSSVKCPMFNTVINDHLHATITCKPSTSQVLLLKKNCTEELFPHHRKEKHFIQ